MKFELFMGCLGNGITVCNKAVEVNGDYKHICHIADSGKVTWYVRPDSIPRDALSTINHTAYECQVKFEKWLDSMSAARRYEYLLDNVPHAAFMHACKMDGDIEDKISYLKNVLFEKSTFVR